VAVTALVVLAAGAVGTYVWALGHWFVGVDGEGDAEQVAVFRGLNVSVVGFDFYELDQDTGMQLADLTPAARSRVRGGITADDAADADRILTALREQRLPVCPPTGPSVATEAPASSTAPRSPAAPSTGAPSTGAPATGAPATGATPTGAPAPTTPATATRTSERTTTSSEPGKDCREAD
jgi:PPM family protein phosphatase